MKKKGSKFEGYNKSISKKEVYSNTAYLKNQEKYQVNNKWRLSP